MGNCQTSEQACRQADVAQELLLVTLYIARLLSQEYCTHLADCVAHKEDTGAKPIDSVTHVDVRLELEGRKGQV